MLCPNIRKGILSINLKWRYKIESPISMREQSKRKMANWFLVIYTYWMTPMWAYGAIKGKKKWGCHASYHETHHSCWSGGQVINTIKENWVPNRDYAPSFHSLSTPALLILIVIILARHRNHFSQPLPTSPKPTLTPPYTSSFLFSIEK